MSLFSESPHGQPKLPEPRRAAAPGPEPFFYTVATNLDRVLHLSRDQQLSIWKRVLEVYARANRGLPQFLKDLCQPPFVESLMENEIFWGMVGVDVNRMVYAHATDYLPAVYATAALMAAKHDGLALAQEDLVLLTGAMRVA